MIDQKYLITSAQIDDLAGVISLLEANDLPASDLIISNVLLWVLKDQDKIIGCIGIEAYGHDAFLRSLAIDINYRKFGLGQSLVNQVIAYSKTIGINKIHLLTTTARGLFEKMGFVLNERKEAPESIRANKQFTQLCSSVAVYMNKEI